MIPERHLQSSCVVALLALALGSGGCITEIVHPHDAGGGLDCAECDAGVDEPDGGRDTAPLPPACSEEFVAFAVTSSPQRLTVSFDGALDSGRGSCSPEAANGAVEATLDRVVRLSLPEAGVLFVRAAAEAGASVPSLHLRATCELPATEREGSCAPRAEAGAETLLMVPVEAGDHVLWLESADGGQATLDVWVDRDVKSCGAGPVLSALPSKLQLVGTTRGLTHLSPFSSSCGAAGRPEVDVRFRLERPTELRLVVEASASGDPAVTASLRGALCSQELACAQTAEDRASLGHSALPGAYTVLFSSPATGGADFRALLTSEPSTRGESCAMPQPLDLLSQGTSTRLVQVQGTTRGRADDHVSGCGGAEGPEAVYSFTTTEVMSLEANVSGTGGPFSVTLRGSACDEAGDTRGCAAGTLTDGTLPPGTWHLLVDGPEAGGDFTLSLRLRLPMVGESYSNPLSLELVPFSPVTTRARLAAHASVDFAERHHDVDLACGGPADRDVVFTFTTTEERDLWMTFPAVAPLPVAAELMSGVCSVLQWCGHNDAGTSALVLERAALPAGDHTLRLSRRGEPAPGEPPLQLAMNLFLPGDRCFGALPVQGPGVHVLTGTTVGYTADISNACGGNGTSPDRAYAITLTGRGSIAATIQSQDATYAPLLALRGPGCTSGSHGCNAGTSGGTAQIEVTDLDPGTYVLWVGGTVQGSSGAYTLTVTIN